MRSGRWVMLGGLIGVYFSFGVVVASIAPMLDLVRADVGASRAQMGFILGAWALLFIGTAPLAGRVIDRYGLRLSVLAGGLSVAGSALARATASGVGTLWLAVAVFGIGGPLVSAGAPTLVRQWFDDPRERRRAVSAYAIAPSLGSVATLSLTNPVLLPLFGSWRGVLVAEGLLALVATAVWMVATGHLARNAGAHPWSSPAVAVDGFARAGGSSSVRRLLSSGSVRLALGLAFPVFFLNHALNAWFPTLLQEVGDLGATAGSNWAAVSRLIGIGAALVIPNLGSRVVGRNPLPGVCGVLALGLLLLGLGSMSTVPLAALIIGARGAMVPLGALLLMEADGVGARNTGTANGLWFAVGEIGGVTGPLSAGLIADSSLGFEGVAIGLSLVAVSTAVGSARMLRRPGAL